MKPFGEKLKELRKAANITQTALADRLNVHLQTVSKWERGISEPDLSLLGELSAVLGVSLEKLLSAPESGETYVGSFSAAAFGKAVAARRKERGRSQEEFAREIGVSADAVSKWERGVICPRAEELVKIASVAGIPVSKLYYAISEEDRTESVIAAKRRKKFSLLWFAAAAMACASAVLVALFLPKPVQIPAAAEEKVFTVVVEGREYKVKENDWFTPHTPVRDGYDFQGFVDETGAAAVFPVQIKENARYAAVFAPHEYLIDYWLNGGYFLAEAPHAFTVESGAVELPEPEKTGAVFEGWYLTPDYTGEPVEQLSCAGREETLYAKWSDAVCSVRYELNGGVLTGKNPAEISAKEEIALCEPLRGGYTFLGWFDGPYGGTRYDAVGGAEARNLTLYALWQKDDAEYTVFYEPNGGKPEVDNPVSVGAGEFQLLAGASKTGYDFAGWNTAADGSGTWYDALRGIRENLKLYAVFTPKTYVVRYEPDGGTYCEGVNPNYIVYGESVDLKPVTKSGCVFLGWFDRETGGEKIETIGAENILRLTTLYARFEKIVYKITLRAGEGVFEADGKTLREHTYALTFGEKLVLPSAVLAGYDFCGWQDESGRIVEKIDEFNIGNMTLTAKYRNASEVYRLIYELDGGAFVTPYAEVVSAGQKILLAEPEKEGFVFLGWNDAPDGSGRYYTVTDPAMEGDLTLYAIWQEIIVNGSTEYFVYEKGASAVTITRYTGPYGENMILKIPAYIDNLPVVGVQTLREKDEHTATLKSVEIPDTVRVLGKEAFFGIHIKGDLPIPAGVEELGEQCIHYVDGAVRFAEGSRLKTIGERAFFDAVLQSALVLPEGVEIIKTDAFASASLYGGIVLPETLRRIETGGLQLSAGESTEIFLPDSVEYVETAAFCFPNMYHVKGYTVYTRRSEAETEGFEEGWDTHADVRYRCDLFGVTLHDGDFSLTLTGGAVVLPEREKQGFRFLGWQEADGTILFPKAFIPQKDCVFVAVYEPIREGDGRDFQNPATAECGVEYKVLLSSCGDGTRNFYFVPDIPSGQRFKIDYDVCGLPEGSTGICLYVQEDLFFWKTIPDRDEYREGTAYRFYYGDSAPAVVEITFRIEML